MLVEGLIGADSRKELVAHTRALDRVLLWGHYVVPNWHIKTWRVAYWNHLAHPQVTPQQDIGLMTWWRKPDAQAPVADPAEAKKAEQAGAPAPSAEPAANDAADDSATDAEAER